jgi:hypothetical protein
VYYIQPHVESVPPSTPVDGGDNTGRVIPPPDEDNGDKTEGNDVYIMNTKTEERATSFFAQPGILAGIMQLHCILTRSLLAQFVASVTSVSQL